MFKVNTYINLPSFLLECWGARNTGQQFLNRLFQIKILEKIGNFQFKKTWNQYCTVQ